MRAQRSILLVPLICLAASAALAEGGAAFIARYKPLKGSARDAALLDAVNDPDWVEVTIKPAKTAKGAAAQHQAVIRVAADYVSVGEDGDFVRMPMTPQLAQKVANKFEASLPTKKLVDDIWAAADVKLTPAPMNNFKVADTPDRYLVHQKAIEDQLAGRDGLIAGQKKDIVVGNMMARSPGKVVIYGWHKPDGKAIQPESSIHSNIYMDYSHGVRLVSLKITVDGDEKDLRDVMKSRELCPLVAYDCPVAAKGVAYPAR